MRQSRNPVPDVTCLVSLESAVAELRSCSRPLPVSAVYHLETILGDLCTSVLCEAVAYLYTPRVLYAEKYERLPVVEIPDHGVQAWLLAAACMLGDLDGMRQQADVLFQSTRSIDNTRSFFKVCLCAAIRYDWDRAFKFLLDEIIEINSSESTEFEWPIKLALKYVRLQYLESMLQAQGGISLMSRPGEGKLLRAVRYPPDRARSAAVVRLLLKYSSSPPRWWARNEIFHYACRTNELSIATEILHMGSVNMFADCKSHPALISRECALTAAAHGDSVDCVRLILETTISDPNDFSFQQKMIARAFAYAANQGSLELLRLILPHETKYTLPECYLYAAKVNGGLRLCDDLYGPPNLSRDVKLHLGGILRSGVLGTATMRVAIEALAHENVGYLLTKDVIPPRNAELRETKTEKETAAWEKIHLMLTEHGHSLPKHKVNFCSIDH